MINIYENQVIDRDMAYWKFKSKATLDDYISAFHEVILLVGKPNIKKLMVVIEAANAWDDETMVFWVKTRDIANEFNIKKWGIVTPNAIIRKDMIRQLVASNGNNTFTHFVSQVEQEAMEWIKS